MNEGRTANAGKGPPADDWSPQERAQLAAQQTHPLVDAHVAGSESFANAPKGVTVETLLVPTLDKPGDPYVHFGSLRVERDLVGDFSAAQRYLAKDPEAVGALYAMQHEKNPLTVARIGDGDDKFQALHNTIRWDPHSALLNVNGSKQTPALGLLHEEGHALEFDRDPQRFAENVSRESQRFTTAEEQRNIRGFEDRALRYLSHEGKRDDHGGIAYDTTAPAQTVVVSGPPLHDPDAVRAAIHDERFALAMQGYPPPPAAVPTSTIEPWNGKPTSGAFLHLDPHTVAQHVGGGRYVTFDVAKDLHGVVPPENDPTIRIDERGHVLHARDRAANGRATEHPGHDANRTPSERDHANGDSAAGARPNSQTLLHVFEDGRMQTVGTGHRQLGKVFNVGPLIGLHNERDGETTMYPRQELLDNTPTERRPALEAALRDGRELEIDIGRHGLVVHDVTPAHRPAPSVARGRAVGPSDTKHDLGL